MKLTEKIELAMNFDVVPSYMVVEPTTHFVLDADAYVAFPQIKCTDKGAIFLKDNKELLTVGVPAAKGQLRSQTLDVFIAYIGPTPGRFYSKAYNPAAPSIDCFSNRGVTPSKRVANPMALTCAECPNSQWTKLESGGNKPPVCKESRKLSLIPIFEGSPYGIHTHNVSGSSEKHSATIKKHLRGADFGSLLKKLSELAAKGASIHGIVMEMATVELPPNSGTIGQIWAYKLKRYATTEEYTFCQELIDDNIKDIENSLYAEDSEPLSSADVLITVESERDFFE